MFKLSPLAKHVLTQVWLQAIVGQMVLGFGLAWTSSGGYEVNYFGWLQGLFIRFYVMHTVFMIGSSTADGGDGTSYREVFINSVEPSRRPLLVDICILLFLVGLDIALFAFLYRIQGIHGDGNYLAFAVLLFLPLLALAVDSYSNKFAALRYLFGRRKVAS